MPQSYFEEIVLAGIGGLLVVVGLFMEHFGDREWYEYKCLSPTRSKSLKYIGEWFVIVGVGIEVIVACVTAQSEWRMKQMIIKNDPRNLPIISIIGRVCLVIQPPFKDFAANLKLPQKYGSPEFYSGSDRLPYAMPFLLSDDKELKKQDMILFQFGKGTAHAPDSDIPIMGQVCAMVDLISESSTNINNIGFEINLYPSTDNSPVFNPYSITFNSLKRVQFSIRNTVPPPLKVVGGRIDLFINGPFQKSFLIRPQTNDNLLNITAFETNGISEF